MLNEFFYRECPCCGAKINKFSFNSRKVSNSTNCELNYQCYHCPTCKNKISSEFPVWSDYAIGGSILIVAYFFAQISVSYFMFKLETLSLALFLILYSTILVFFIEHLIATFVPLKCTKLTENKYDNQPDKNIIMKGKNGIDFVTLDDDARIDPLERKVMFNIAMFPTYMFLLTIVFTIVYVIYDVMFN